MSELSTETSFVDAGSDTDDSSCELTIVIPVYRNEKTITALIDELQLHLDDSAPDHRILMVDDASPDNSWAVLSGLCKENPRVAGVRLNYNSGQHMALITGLSLCNSKWIAIMDADLQDSPALMPQLLEKAKLTNATIFAERHGKYQSLDRMLTSRAYKTVLSWVTGVPKRCGTFFLTSRSVLDSMLEYKIPAVQVVILTAFSSSSIDTVPFERAYRQSSESGYSFRTRFEAAMQGYRCAFYCLLYKAGWRGLKKYSLPHIAERAGWV